jgi:hypothetical protein
VSAFGATQVLGTMKHFDKIVNSVKKRDGTYGAHQLFRTTQKLYREPVAGRAPGSTSKIRVLIFFHCVCV